ncbi:MULTISPECIES: DUF317 domain-containing protein [unclassified Streptomyces]|uniref:DUF317 domain-containing protein n=1 Tax=unclassified Streptomyces TaxID=2593676 RepID=UPI00403C2FDC
MPVSKKQLADFADTHLWRLPFDTSPRHLAGPGDGRHVTHGLAAAGWQRTSDVLSPEIVLISPDQRHSLQFDPQSATSAWWRLRAEPTGFGPGWYAEFGELVPAELLAAATDALVSATAPGRSDPFRRLQSANWPTDGPHAAHSPDGMCSVERRFIDGHSTRFWHIEVSEPGHGVTPQGPRLWHAVFDSRTPHHLVNAFVTALADPAPLQRGMYEHTAHHNAVQEPSALTPQQVVAAHTSRLDAIRAQTRAARRHQQTPTTAQAPVTSPAARPTARR